MVDMNGYEFSDREPLMVAALVILFCLLVWRLRKRLRKYSPKKRAERIMEALRQGRDVRIVYWSKSRRQFVKEVVTPESLKGLYMKAHDHARGITRKFNITRIREVVVYPHPALGSALIPPESQMNQYITILLLFLMVTGLLAWLRYDVQRTNLSALNTANSPGPTERGVVEPAVSNAPPADAGGAALPDDSDAGVANERPVAGTYSRSSRAYYDQAFALSTRGDFGGVIEYSTRAIDLDPYYAQAFCLRALGRVMKGDLDGAIADCTKAIELNPRYSQAYYIRGGARDEKGDSSGALTDYTEAIEIKPDFADAYNARAWAQYRRGDFETAIEDVNQALQLTPKSANAYDTRGWAKYAKGDREGAVADCSRAVQLDPQSAVGYNSQGLLLFIAGEYNEAVASWNQAIQLSPSVKSDLVPWIEKARKRLRK